MASTPGRRRFFWTLVFLFFITTTIILFYTFGYRFDSKRGLFIHTGSFTLKVTPIANVTLEIDGNPVSARSLSILNNAFHIDSQIPGEHFIRVSAPGYFPWEKKAIIESGRSTEFWNITLIGKEYPQTPIAGTESIKKIFPSPKSNLFALIGVRDGGTVISTLDTDNMLTSEITFIPQTSPESTVEENIEWSPNTDQLLVPLVDADGKTISFLVHIESGETINITEKSHIPDIQYPRWDGRQKNVFYFLSKNTLYEWSSDNLEIPPSSLVQDISGYDISQGDIYFMDQKTGIIFRLASGDAIENAEQITNKEIETQGAPYSITVYDKNRIAIRNRNTGALFIFNIGEDDYFKMLGSGIKGVQFSNDGKKLLFENDREIFVYFVRPWNTQPLRAENEILQIARLAAPIQFIQWTKDYEHVLFTYNNTIKTIELDNRDKRDIETVYTVDTPPLQVLAVFPSNQIFLVEEKNGDALSTIPFPIIPLQETLTP